jgi:hypothetical protein
MHLMIICQKKKIEKFAFPLLDNHIFFKSFKVIVKKVLLTREVVVYLKFALSTTTTKAH